MYFPSIPLPEWFSLLLINRIYQSTILLALYRCFKVILKLSTNTTELSRICAVGLVHRTNGLDHGVYENYGAGKKIGEKFVNEAETIWRVSPDIIFRVDRSILFSKELVLERRELETKTNEDEVILKSILVKKRFPNNGSPTSGQALVLGVCLKKITDSYRLLEDVGARTRTVFDPSDKSHERQLLTLWEVLMPNEKLKDRISSQWKTIGFQGTNPATDFRGMGMLGLDDLHYLVTKHKGTALKLFQSSRQSEYYYPFAIVSINITRFAVQLLQTRQLQYLLFTYGTTKRIYHEFFVYLFIAFNKFWTELEPPVQMFFFEEQFKDFKRNIAETLMLREVVLGDISKIDMAHAERQEHDGEEDLGSTMTIRKRKKTI